MGTLPAYILAAFGEIGGCFAFWAWLRLGKSALWLAPGMASLALFAWALTRIDAPFAGRAYTAASTSWRRSSGCGPSRDSGRTAGTPSARRSASSAPWSFSSAHAGRNRSPEEQATYGARDVGTSDPSS